MGALDQQGQATKEAADSLFAYIKNVLDGKVDQVTGKSLSEEDFTTALKNKLDNVEAGAQVNVATDLAFSRNQTSVTVQSSTGTNATIAAATETAAGVMTGTDKAKLNTAVESSDFTSIVKVTESNYPASPVAGVLYIVVPD